MLKIYCIIVTYNGEKYIQKCLESITDDIYKIIIIDNNSTDSTTEIIEKNFSNVHLIKLADNLGFGKANNIGIHVAISDGANYFFLINQDVYLNSDTVRLLLNAAAENPAYGIISPIHLNATEILLDYHFYRYLTTVESHDLWSDILLDKAKTLYELPFVNAAAWFISEECIKAVGGFDSIFEHYGEDNDYINRALYKNFKIGICCKAKIIHDRGFYNNFYYFSDYKKLKLTALIYLKNLNHSLSYLFIVIVKNSLVNIFNNLLEFNLRAVYNNIILPFRLICYISTIRKSRFISKSPNSFLKN